MKKLLLPIVLSLVLGGCIGFFVGNRIVNAKKEEANKAILRPSPLVAITQKEAQLLVDTYRDHGAEDGSQQVGGHVKRTRSVFIPLTELDKLDHDLDAERNANHVTDGIRIYMARYPLKQLDGITPYDNPYRNTIVLVSTKAATVTELGGKVDKIHLDYYDSGSKSLVMKDLLKFAIPTPPQNRSELCPDACQGATLVCTNPSDPTCSGN